MRVDDILEHVSGTDVLDIGCAGHEVRPGTEDWLHGRLRERYRVTGIDISGDNIAFLRSLGFEDLHVQSADDFHLERQFDTIVAGEVVEHLSNVGQFFACARRHLAPRGRLVLSTPYVFSWMYALYAAHHFPKTCQNGEHTTWFCPRTLAEVARREGLEIESLRLVFDYSPAVRSWKYQLFWKVIRVCGAFLPDRCTKTNMVVVLRPVGSDVTPENPYCS